MNIDMNRRTFGKLAAITLASATTGFLNPNPVPASEFVAKEVHKTKIGDDKVIFKAGLVKGRSHTSYAKTTITVTKPDGRIIEYMDRRSDWNLDIVRIEKDGKEKFYARGGSSSSRMMIEEAQERYKTYLKIIKEEIGKKLFD